VLLKGLKLMSKQTLAEAREEVLENIRYAEQHYYKPMDVLPGLYEEYDKIQKRLDWWEYVPV
jgi:hypothetical protein